MVQTFKKVKAIGYDHVELGELGPIDPKELKKLVDAEELSICASHVELSRLQNELNVVIEEHHIWECKNVVISALPKEDQNEDGYKRFAVEGSEIGRRLKEQGISLSYHNHWWELEKFDSRTGLEILFEESDPDAFFFEIDTCWLQHGGGDPSAWIRRMKGRQRLVHFKDMILPSIDTSATLEVGEGNLDFPSIIQTCKDAGVQWYIVEQDYCPGDPFESIEISYRNLKSMGL